MENLTRRIAIKAVKRVINVLMAIALNFIMGVVAIPLPIRIILITILFNIKRIMIIKSKELVYKHINF